MSAVHTGSALFSCFRFSSEGVGHFIVGVFAEAATDSEDAFDDFLAYGEDEDVGDGQGETDCEEQEIFHVVPFLSRCFPFGSAASQL